MTLRDAQPWIRRGVLTTAAIMLGLVGFRWLPLMAGDRAPAAAPREIVLVARSMAFFVEGSSTPNPTLRLRAGETVRLVLRNEEPGVTHDFAVRSWNLATRELVGEGVDGIEFRVPHEPGRQEYQCRPHAAMMRGTIEIR